MQKIKVLYIVSTLESKGPTNQLFYLIKYLDREVFDPMILTLSPEPKASMKASFEKEGIDIQTLGTGRLSGILKNKKILKQILQKFKPDIIQSMGIRADGYNAGFGSEFKRITTSRNFPLVDYVQKFGKIKGLLMAKMHIAYFKNLEVVACSMSIFKQLSEIGVSSTTIQNGVDLSRFSPESITEMKNESTVDEKIVFVTVGSLIFRKNNSQLIQAFNGLGEDFKLIVVGDGPESDDLKSLDKLGNIEFVGHQSDVKKYLLEADAFVSASRAEGLPNAVLEAMACDLPVILSDIPPHRELVEGSEFDTFLFNLDDVEDLKEKIQNFSKQLHGLGGVARGLVSKRFAAEVMSKKYQKLYLQVSK